MPLFSGESRIVKSQESIMVSARVLQIVLLAVELAGVFARDCRTNDSDSASIPTLYVSSQQDLDGLDGCTNLTGNIVLLSDYSGPFRLNGVTDLNGGIAMNASGYSENVESFEMLDVVNYAGVLQLYQVPDVRLPKVERMNELSLRSYKGGKADLGALVESELVGIAGVYETNLESLRHVGTSGIILSSYMAAPWNGQETGSIEVVLPALESTAGLNIYGYITKLSLPRLANITRDPSGLNGELFNSTIRPQVSTLDVQLPALTTLDYPLAAMGLVSTLNLSSLVQADQDIFVETETSVNVSFPVLERAQGIYLEGSIQSFNAPALRSATVLDVSTIGINPCSGTLLDIYVAPYDASKSGVRCPANSTTSSDSTSSSDSPSSSDSTPVPETSHHPALQPGAIAGIVVGCVVAVGLVGAGIFVLRKRRTQAKKQNAAVSAVSPGEGGDDDAPPPYSRNPAS